MAKKRVAIDRKQVIEAIGLAAKKLGRPPHRGELPRVAGVSHSAVLKHFACLRDAVRACGLEPSRRGLKVPPQDLLEDFGRVATELGRSPNRNEYLRHGKYAPGTMYARFGSWPGVTKAASKWQLAASQTGFTTEATEERREEKHSLEMDAGGRRFVHGEVETREHESDKAIALRWATAMPAIPGELAGKRRVTDVVCAMIVNTLMGEEAGLKWQRMMMGLEPSLCENCQRLKIGTPGSDERGLARIEPQGLGTNGGALSRVKGQAGVVLARLNGSVTSGGIINDSRPVMGPPFHSGALSNAPANETGVVFLFGMLAGELGFQIEAVRGEYPDIEAKRQIQPGKWQRVWIEVEYESRNFALHRHDPAKCDIIVCWKHNWAKCPKHIEVIELSKIVERVIG